MENTVRSSTFQFGLPGWRIFEHIKRGIGVNWASAAGNSLTSAANIETRELELAQNQHHNSKPVPEPEPKPAPHTDDECRELNCESKIIPPVVTDSALLKQHNIDQCIQIKLDRNQVSNLIKMKIQSQPKKQSKKSTKSTPTRKASQDKNGCPIFTCSYRKCGHKSFLQEYALNNHLAMVHGEYPFKCDLCTEHKGYRSNKNLKRHALNIHSPAELRKLLRVCPFPQCKTTFYKFNVENYNQHIKRSHDHHFKKQEPNLLKPKPNPTLNMVKQSPSKATPVILKKQNILKPNYLKKYNLKSNLPKQHLGKASVSKLKQGISTSKKRILEKQQQQHRFSRKPLPELEKQNCKIQIQNKTAQTKLSLDSKPMQLQNRTRHGVKKPLKKCFFPGCNFTGKSASLWYHHIKCHVQEKRFHCHLCPYKAMMKQSLKRHLKHTHGKIVEAAEIPHVSYRYRFTAKSYSNQISERKLLQRYNITQNVQVKLENIVKKIPSTFKNGMRSRIPASRSKNPKPTTSNSKSMQSFQIRNQFRTVMWNQKRAQQDSCKITKNKTRRGRGRAPQFTQNKTIVYKEGLKNNLNLRHKNPYGNQFVARRRPGRPPKVKPNETVVKNRLFQHTFDSHTEEINLIQISNLNFANCDLFKMQSLQLPSSCSSLHSDSYIDIAIHNNSNISDTSQPIKNNISSNYQMEPKQKIMLEQESNGNSNSSLLTSHNQNQQHQSRALQNCNGMFFQNLRGLSGKQTRQRKRNLKILKESPSTTTTTTTTASLNLKLARSDLKESGLCTFTDFTSDPGSISSISSPGIDIENQKYSSSTIQGLQNLENFDAYEIVARRIDPDGSVTYQVVWREPVQNWTEELILGQPEPQKHLMDFDFHFDGEIEFGIGEKNNVS